MLPRVRGAPHGRDARIGPLGTDGAGVDRLDRDDERGVSSVDPSDPAPACRAVEPLVQHRRRERGAQGKANAALARPYEAIGEAVRRAAVAHADETRHPIGTQRESVGSWWLWVLASVEGSDFVATCTRGKIGAQGLLGDFEGVLVTDDYAAYGDVPSERRQLCWAHLLRHFAAIGGAPPVRAASSVGVCS